jgi:GNAT superfamily N-acetyltransferase
MTYVLQRATVDDMLDIVQIDEDSTTLYATAGMPIDLAPEHPFGIAERERWVRSAAAGRLFIANDEPGDRVGFAALDLVDGMPYLDQLSVRRAAMGKGAGRFLLHEAIAWAEREGARSLWLTTYGHLPWNRPFYEREGFEVVSEAACGPGILHHLQEQRAALPAPEHRVAMRCALPARASR